MFESIKYKKVFILFILILLCFLSACNGSKQEKNIKKMTDFFIIDSISKVELEVNDLITSKEKYVNAKISIKGEDYNLNTKDVMIRLRGNSSLSAPKKSYKLKFLEKIDLFGFGMDKEWALIANYYDTSLMRNYYAYKLAQAMGIEYSVDCKYVELWINGINKGLYLLTETVKTGSERVNIETVYSKEDIEIPFLLELDMKMVSKDDPLSNGIKDIDYFEVNIPHYKFDMYAFGTKYPENYTSEFISQAQYDYIKSYIRNMYSSLDNNTFKDYIDIDSAIDFYMVQEIMMNIDMDYSSVYMYKPVNEKLHFGPVWDFDISSGNCNYTINPYSPETLMKNVNEGSRIINKLLENEEVRNRYLERLNQLGEAIIPGMEASFDINYEILKEYEEKDNATWKNLNASYWPKPAHLVKLTYKEQVLFLKDYLVRHYNYMLENI